MLVFMFLNETKAAHLFESCESESVSQICPQNCPQKGLEQVSAMQHSFVHMGQNLFRALVRNTTKPNKITSQRINFEFLITRRSQVQVLSPQPTKNGKTSSFTVLFLFAKGSGYFYSVFIQLAFSADAKPTIEFIALAACNRPSLMRWA
jgi:hypothetical protein